MTGKLCKAISVGGNDTLVVYCAKEEALKSYKLVFDTNHSPPHHYREKLNMGHQLEYHVRDVKCLRRVQILAGVIIGMIVLVIIFIATIYILVLRCFNNPFPPHHSLFDD